MRRYLGRCEQCSRLCLFRFLLLEKLRIKRVVREDETALHAEAPEAIERQLGRSSVVKVSMLGEVLLLAPLNVYVVCTSMTPRRAAEAGLVPAQTGGVPRSFVSPVQVQ